MPNSLILELMSAKKLRYEITFDYELGAQLYKATWLSVAKTLLNDYIKPSVIM